MEDEKPCGLERSEIETIIDRLICKLTKISDDSGDFLLTMDDGRKVDDKSWNVWNWPQGIGLFGLFINAQNTGNEKAMKALKDWFDQGLRQGTPPKNVNTMAPFLAMAYLYELEGDEKYVPYLEQWAEWVMCDMPRTPENGLQHETYGSSRTNQLWDDTLMMTVLPLAKIGLLLGRDDYVEEAKYQFLVHIKYLVDTSTGLWFHGWSFEGRHNFAGALWGRGNCWATIAIPVFLDILNLPKGDPLRAFLIATLEDQVAALEKYQSESGLWHTLIDDSTSYEESSATAGIAYGILRGVHKRYIDPKYSDVAEKAILGLLDCIDEDGEVSKVSVGTPVGETKDFYKTIDTTAMPYGQSLTILALTELLVSYC